MSHGFDVGNIAIITSSPNEGKIVRVIANTFDGTFHGFVWVDPTADLIIESLGSELNYYEDLGEEHGIVERAIPELPFASMNLTKLLDTPAF